MDAGHTHDLLLRAVSDLSFARDLAQVTAVVRAAARRLTGADGVTFILKQGAECYYADEDAIEPLWKGMRFPLRACISGWVMEHRQPAAIRDIYQDPRVPHEAYRPTFVKSLLVVPVRDEDPIAAIGAYWAAEHDPTATEWSVLEALARAASLALLNVQLWGELQAGLQRERDARIEAEHAKAEAEKTAAVKDEFLATVSHELRTPLNVVQGWLWRLGQPSVSEELRERALHVLERNVALQVRLVEDLLDISRAVTGRLEIREGVVDLAAVCGTVVDLARESAESKGVHVAFRTGATSLVWGDADRVQQIVSNLLENAIKFTPAEGRIEVVVDRTDDRVRLTIADTGVGINQDFLPHVFERFRQADATPTRDHRGLGIGLTIVQHLVRLQAGTVLVESDGHGRGTTVRVEFPMHVARATSRERLRLAVTTPPPDAAAS